VAVRMISEGVDIPRLRVGVYATNTVTDLFFRQAVGRLVRVSRPGLRQFAYMFIPDDARLRLFASGIAEQRRHSLRKPEQEGEAPFGRIEALEETPERDPGEQLSLFAAISAIPLDEHGRVLEPSRLLDDAPAGDVGLAGDAEQADEVPDFLPADAADAVEAVDPKVAKARRPAMVPLLREATPLPEVDETEAGTSSTRSRRLQLRELNGARVRRLVRCTRKGHADINAELNRAVGIRRVTEATVAELERRLEFADRWIAKVTGL